MKIRNLNKYYYRYRYDLFSLLIVYIIILWFFSPLLSEGHIVFSDLDFPSNSSRYLDEIFGLWNDKWNTPTSLNLPRLIYLSIPYLISNLNGSDGTIFIKSFILMNIIISSFTMYLLSKSIIGIYLDSGNSFLKLVALSIGAIFYGINPWVIFRIQHIYLLCGYSLLPLALMYFVKIFDPKFQSKIITGYSVFRIKLYKKNILHIGLLSITISIMSAAIHYFFYTLILIVILWVLLLTKQMYINRSAGSYLRKAILYNYIIKGALLAFFTLLFSYYWFSVYFGSILFDAQPSQNNINVVDTLTLFSKNSSLLKSSLMISYWWPMFDLSTLGLRFYIGGFILLSIILTGIISYIKKYNLLLFLFLLTILFLLFSTGTSLPYFGDIFIKLVMDVPFFGNLFRDPNKLIGIISIGYSVFLVFGLEKLFRIKIKGLNKSYVIKLSIFALIILSYILYISPFRDRFVKGFYYPVKVPQEYSDLQNNYNIRDGRVLHFPVSGNMLETSTGVTTLDWNDNPDDFGENKATGDISIYMSLKNTIFHHEGSSPSTSYYINFLQYILDHGLTENFGKYLYPLGVNELAYGTGFTGHEERQQFNLDILKRQKDLDISYENRYFNLFDTTYDVKRSGIVDKIIFTSKGFQSFSSISSIPGFSLENIGTIYNSQLKGNQLLNVRKGDLIESTTLEELLLASLPKQYYLSPAESISNGNPFLGWSRSATHTSDWLWHLKSQNIKPLRFDMSFQSGLALSFSSVRLDIPVHKKNKIKGREYLSFDDLLYGGYNFTADNSSIVDIETYPLSITMDLPLVHGIISKGQNYNIWQVAKSGLIPATPETPYQFFLTISGRGTNKMHLKARFYNDKKREVGTAYILTPEEAINYEYFKFYGEYITPKDTAYIRVDILSFQRPEQKTHWWIHDFSIFELSEYSAPNTIDMIYKPKNRDTLVPYIRLFHSPEGGSVKVSIGNSSNVINTEKYDFSGFLWNKLENYNSNGEEIKVTIENLSGFNSVNEMVLISSSDLKKERVIMENALKKAQYLISLESEYDFDYLGSIQSKRTLTSLSMGQGRSSFNGVLSSSIDLPKDGEYYINLELAGRDSHSHFDLNLVSSDKKGAYSKTITNTKSITSRVGHYIEDIESINGSYYKEISETPGVIPNLQMVGFKTPPLPKGEYQFNIRLRYTGDSLSSVEDLGYFNPSYVVVPDYKEPVDLDGYSECISIYKDMIKHSLYHNKMTIKYDKTCSADWYITSSSKIAIVPGDEYIISYDMISQNLKSRHCKLLYLNDKEQVIKTDFIPEVEERFKSKWNAYQYISKAPKNAKTMMFHIWGRGNKELESTTEIKNLSIFSYKLLPLVDRVYISERPLKEILKSSEESYTFYNLEDSPMSKKFINSTERNDAIAIKFDLSPHAIWEMAVGRDVKRSKTNINGLRVLFFTKQMGEGEVYTILKKSYFFGLILWPIGILLIILIYINAKKKSPLFRRMKRTLRKIHFTKRH